MRFRVGEIVELTAPVSVPIGSLECVQIPPGKCGTVIAPPTDENELMVISIEKWETIIVRPDQVKSTGQMSGELLVVTEEEIEAE